MANARSARITAARELLAIETVARSIQARHLQTSLKEAVWIEPNQSARRASKRLHKFDYDQAPVGAARRLQGYVLTAELEGLPGSGGVGAAIHAIDAEHILSASAGVLEVLEALHAGGPLAFVVDGRSVTGFVTPADLNKLPARTHFYLLLTNLESALAAWVRTTYPDLEVAVQLLGDDDAKKVRSRFRRDQRNNVAVNLVTGMDLGHLLEIVGSSKRGQDRFGAPSDRPWETWTLSLKSLRHAVMHPVLTFLGPKRTLAELLVLESDLRGVLARATQDGSVSRRPAL